MEKRKEPLHFARPSIGSAEIREVVDSLRNGWITMGPKTQLLEGKFRDYVGSSQAVAVSSCTAALHLSLIAKGIGKGDEVITSPLTFAATANVIHHVGAKPVFADVEYGTFNIDPEKIRAAITKGTKAIIPVHYAGQPCNMNEIKKIAEEHNLAVIEDAAHAVGAEYENGKKVGSSENLTCFSFYAIKNLTTGEGGMITCNDDGIAARLKRIRLHGISKDAWKRYSASGSWYYEIEEAGFKYNMTDINASIGLHQLEKIDSFNRKRKSLSGIYNRAFSSAKDKIRLHEVSRKIVSSYHLYPIVLREGCQIDRNEMILGLNELNIGTSVHFIPLNLQPFYRKTYGYKEGDFPIAEEIYRGLISLPLYPSMKKEDAKYVAEAVLELAGAGTI